MANHLAQSKSLYLRKHADNPIDWWPWCNDALTLAKAQDRPIFLSIGYSSCHWCTVMEGEAFSDDAIAAYMNDHFVPIKVDREERPDLDSIYMQALQMMAGQGGWPLNLFLTPDRVPFYGGTYFPVEPRYGRPGFLEVLKAIHQFYNNEAKELETMTSQMLTQLQQLNQLSPKNELTPETLLAGLDYSAGILSSTGAGPRFPMIPYADAALRGARFQQDSRYDAAALTQQRGTDLALGGIYDHVGGGFHRYTVDSTWTVPHFEKMLYDNGQIIEYLANLWSANINEPAHRRAIDGTVNWLKREMTAPDGYFYAAQDADSFATPEAGEPEEGEFYVWDYIELTTLLTDDELTLLSEVFNIPAEGNFEGHIVLQRHSGGEITPPLQLILDNLFRQRYGLHPDTAFTVTPARSAQDAKAQTGPGRIPPVTDTKMIVAWNSLMISGLARAAAVFDRLEYYQIAVRAARFILEHQWQTSRLHRLNYDGMASIPAQAEDYALLIKALLDLDQAALVLEPTAEWIEAAEEVQQEFDRLLGSGAGGYFNTADDMSDDILVRERSYTDSAIPSANGVAIANLVRLAIGRGNLAYLDQAEQALKAFSTPLETSPQSCPSLFVALDWYQNHTLLKTTGDEARAVITQYEPTLLTQIADLPDGAVGLVCQGLSCQEPAQSLEQLKQQVARSQRRWGS